MPSIQPNLAIASRSAAIACGSALCAVAGASGWTSSARIAARIICFIGIDLSIASGSRRWQPFAMAFAPLILGAARARDHARFAKGAQNFVDRASARLPGFLWLSLGAAAAAILMTVVGGLGTWDMPIGLRALFWALLMGWNAVKWQTWFALLVRRNADWWRASALGALLLNLSLPVEIKGALYLCGYRAAMAPATTIWIEALAISGVLLVLLVLLGRRLGGAKAGAP